MNEMSSSLRVKLTKLVGLRKKIMIKWCCRGKSGQPATSMGHKKSKLGASGLSVPTGFDPTLREGNPHYGYRMQLYCSTGYHIAILPNGKVIGIDEDMDKHGD